MSLTPAYDRVKMTVSGTPGTGNITLGSAVTNYRSFNAAGVPNGGVVSYVIEDGANWEVGSGTYATSGTVLTRTSVLDNSAGTTSPISLTSSATVFLSVIANDINLLEEFIPQINGAQVLAKYWGIVCRQSADGTYCTLNELQFKTGGALATPASGTSSVGPATGGNVVANMYDGNDSTIYDMHSQDASVIFEYANNHAFDSISLKARNDGFYNQTPLVFDVVYSNDGISLSPICTICAAPWTAADQIQTFAIPPVTPAAGAGQGTVGKHKFWRLANIQSFDGTSPSAAEIEMHGVVAGSPQVPNTAISSANYSGDPIANAYDGSTSTIFAFNAQAAGMNNFAEYQFTTPVAMVELKISSRTDASFGQAYREFDVLFSDDGQTYQFLCHIADPHATPTGAYVGFYSMPTSFPGGTGANGQAGSAYSPPAAALFTTVDSPVTLTDTKSHGLSLKFDGTSVYSGIAYKTDTSIRAGAYTLTAKVQMKNPVGQYPGAGICVGRVATFGGTQYGWNYNVLQNNGSGAGLVVMRVGSDRTYSNSYYSNQAMTRPPEWFRITWDATGVMNFLVSFNDGQDWINFAGTSADWDDNFGSGSGSGPDSLGLCAIQSNSSPTNGGLICTYWVEQPGINNLYGSAY